MTAAAETTGWVRPVWGRQSRGWWREGGAGRSWIGKGEEHALGERGLDGEERLDGARAGDLD